jgi:ferrochelatase
MAPHFSRLSVARYYEEVAESKSGVEIAPIESWHLLPGYVDALAERVGAALARFPAGDRATVPVVFTAHSLPQRVREWDDPYPRQLEETRCAVLDRIGPRSSRFAFQSAGMSPEPWLGPDVGEVLDELAAEGHRSVLVAPIGFVCDHVEVLYDLDIVLQERARVLGVRLERTEMLNDAPGMIGGLAGLVRDTAGRAGWM